MKKKHKLVVVTRSGKEYKLGFLSPCRNGYVLGTPRVKEVDTSHLTIISKEGILSSHITPQEHPQNRRYFPQLNLEDFAKAFPKRVEQNLVSPLSTNQLSEQVMYITQKFFDWLDSLMNILFEERTSPKEVIHVLNFKRLVEEVPQLTEELKNSPSSFLGLCEAKEILKDNSKIYGLSNSRLLIIPFENKLYGVDFSLITNFVPTLEQEEISGPLAEVYESIGIPQYMRKMAKEKIVERLLSRCADSQQGDKRDEELGEAL